MTQPLGVTFRTQEIALGQVPYNNGATVSLDVQRGLLLKSLRCRFSGTVTVATVNGTTILSDAPLGAITRVELTADGRKPFVSADARSLFRLSHIMVGKRPELVPPTSPNIGTYNISGMFRVDLQAMRFAFPVDSFLDTRLYDGLQLKFTFGPGSTIITPGGGGTVTINAGTVIDVTGEYTASGFEFVKFNRLILTDEFAVTAASSALTRNIARNGLLAHTLIRSDIDNIVNDAMITDVTIRSDNTILHKDHLNWASTQARNLEDFQIDLGGTGGLLNGYNFLDFSEDNMLSSCIDTAALTTLEQVYGTTLPAGTNRLIRATHVFYEPVIR